MGGEANGPRRRGLGLALGIALAAVVALILDSWAFFVLAAVFAAAVAYVFASLARDEGDDEDPSRDGGAP
ncbi:hypothetical protein [Microbacterium sp. G2-8]|uniref:hypothetical protein n=1 Tax=Microbacterium sp. G2-8 TaxID=2842454 RepID=UPI001C893E4A|nr:hypothetical protein [Microbacterium sp. G2-8]